MKIWPSLRKAMNFIGIAFGATLAAFSIQGFIVHARLGGGGVGGIALILFYTLGLPIGLMTLLLNIPLFILGWREVSRQFIIKTIIGLGIFTTALDLFKGIQPLPSDDIFLGALYGGVLGGLGSGIVFRFGGSLGGTDIVAKVIQRRFGWAMGTTMLSINALIILVSWAVLGPKVALYTLISMFTFSRTVDVIQSGIPAKAVTIISNRSDALADRILHDVGRGATFLQGRGSYSEEEKNIIICVVSMPELGHLKRVIREVDPQAFLIIQNASEVVGRGWAME